MIVKFSTFLSCLFLFMSKVDACNSRGGVNCKSSNDIQLCPFHPQPQQLTEDDYSNTLNSLFTTVSESLAGQVDKTTRPGISANVAYMNQIIWEGNFGQVSKSNTSEPTGNTIYRIASISKIFPTIFLYKLWEDGRLDLDDPIVKYAPNFRMANPFSFTGQLTLRDLAGQISGIPSFFPFDLLERDYFAWNGTLEETLTRLEDEFLLIEPRTTCYYSNMAYALLANILARNFSADGTFDSWAQKYIVNNLGLTNTGFVLTDEIKAEMATGYYPTGEQAPLLDTNWFRPAGNYYSTTRDLATLSMSLMGTSSARILNRETLVEMLTVVQKCSYGYISQFTGTPWEINEKQTYMIIQKDGDIDGYSSTLLMIPDLQLSMSILMNGGRPTDPRITDVLIDQIVPVFADLMRKKNQTLLATDNPSRYEGLYVIDNIQSWNVTSSEDNILTMTNPNDPGSPFQTVGLSFVSEGILKLTLLGGAFPCMIGSSNLEVQNGALLQFSNITGEVYNQFDMPGLNFYGFKRQQ